MLGEQREVGGAAGNRLDQVHAARQRRVRVGRGARRSRQRRRQALEAALGLGGQRGVALARAQRGQARMVRPWLGRGFALGEHLFEVARDGLAMRSQLMVEVLPGTEAAHGGDARAIVLVFRQVMALRVVEVLQPMLDVTQEDVGRAQLLHRRCWKQVFLPQDFQGLQSRLHAKLGIPPAADQLHRLHDELDLADPARPELDVLGELAALDVAPDFGVQRAHRRQRGVVEVLAKYEGPYDGLERRGGRG